MARSNLNALVRFLRKGPYQPRADANFAAMRKAESKRRRRRIHNLELVAAGALQVNHAAPRSGLIRLS